ncbi:MAG TPA: hypothetical protein VD860_02710 [Azospirillum sp.]|nr:hypothetical protein [Azospirillum sp.]
MSGNAAIVSVYMANIHFSVVAMQKAVVEQLAPPDMPFHQLRVDRPHAESLDAFLNETDFDTVVVLDIDCIPLHGDALPMLRDEAAKGQLVGAVQRANHIANGGHLYAGPFCMAFTRDLWARLGKPSFQGTVRGDVGEELTYRCEEEGVGVRMLWPTAVEEPLWPLRDGAVFGYGTEYESAFWHCFEIRDPRNQLRFTNRCFRALEGR